MTRRHVFIAVGAVLAAVFGPRLVVGEHSFQPRHETKTEIAGMAVRVYAFESYPTWRGEHPDEPCPTSVDVLREYSSSTDTIDPWGTPYEVVCEGRRLVVHSRGEDGVEGTYDDIWSEPDRVPFDWLLWW